MNVGGREIGARQGGGSAKLVSDNHALDGPRGLPTREGDLYRRARVAELKGLLVEENSAVVLCDQVEVLRQGPLGPIAVPLSQLKFDDEIVQGFSDAR